MILKYYHVLFKPLTSTSDKTHPTWVGLISRVQVMTYLTIVENLVKKFTRLARKIIDAVCNFGTTRFKFVKLTGDFQFSYFVRIWFYFIYEYNIFVYEMVWSSIFSNRCSL